MNSWSPSSLQNKVIERKWVGVDLGFYSDLLISCSFTCSSRFRTSGSIHKSFYELAFVKFVSPLLAFQFWESNSGVWDSESWLWPFVEKSYFLETSRCWARRKVSRKVDERWWRSFALWAEGAWRATAWAGCLLAVAFVWQVPNSTLNIFINRTTTQAWHESRGARARWAKGRHWKSKSFEELETLAFKSRRTFQCE